jgi:hypothetical protein
MARSLRRALPTSYVGRLARWHPRDWQAEKVRDLEAWERELEELADLEAPTSAKYRPRVTLGLLRRWPALEEGLAQALGPPGRVRPRQLELFEATAALDVDGRPVDLGQEVELHPEGLPGVLVEVRACRPVGGTPWHSVTVELDEGGPRHVRGSHQVRARA